MQKLISYGHSEKCIYEYYSLEKIKKYYESILELEKENMIDLLTGIRIAVNADNKIWKSFIDSLANEKNKKLKTPGEIRKMLLEKQNN